MPPETNIVVLIIGAVGAAIVTVVTALVPVMLAYIAAYLRIALAKIEDIRKETKEQTKKLDDTALKTEKLVSRIDERIVWSSKEMAFVTPTAVKNDDEAAR